MNWHDEYSKWIAEHPKATLEDAYMAGMYRHVEAVYKNER